MPRRYHAYPEEFQVLNVMSSAGASILGVGLPDPDGLPGLVDALRQEGARQPVGRHRAWSGRPPRRRPTENFDTPPVVPDEAYDYAAAEVIVV